MNDKTEQSLADALRCTAAGGRAEIINAPGYPLMVRAVDYNTLRADLDRAIVNFGDAAATVCDMRAQLAEAQKDAARLDWLGNQFVTVRVPLRYGSKECFMGSPTDKDGEFIPWNIRAAIDAAKGKTP